MKIRLSLNPVFTRRHIVLRPCRATRILFGDAKVAMDNGWSSRDMSRVKESDDRKRVWTRQMSTDFVHKSQRTTIVNIGRYVSATCSLVKVRLYNYPTAQVLFWNISTFTRLIRGSREKSLQKFDAEPTTSESKVEALTRPTLCVNNLICENSVRLTSTYLPGPPGPRCVRYSVLYRTAWAFS